MNHLFYKPGEYIAHCVGHENFGSIFSLLKNKGWIVKLYSSQYEEDSNHRSFYVYVKLTDEGLSKLLLLIINLDLNNLKQSTFIIVMLKNRKLRRSY